MLRNDLRLALDLGTTTLAGRLIDAKGARVAESRQLNPQSVYGSDIIRRLEAARDGEAASLQSLLREGVDRLVVDLLGRAGRGIEEISSAAAAGNPGICHLLRRLPVERILFPPHRPAETAGIMLPPGDHGLALPVPLYLFPLVNGYVGGDLVAFLYGIEGGEARPSSRLYVDIGTNGEMALHTGDRWLVTSVAAGPAFEGGGIACGMAVSLGAVERVRAEGDSLRLEVVGGGRPRGLCGSGLVSAIAAAREGGLIDARGTIVDPAAVATNLSRYLLEDDGGRSLRLYRDAEVDLVLTQQDVRSFQLAKGAVRAGIDCLLGRAGLSAGQVDEVVMTGAFGLSFDLPTLKRVALLPQAMVDKVRFVPAGALAGVGRLLTDPKARAEVEKLTGRLQPFPLSGTPAFERAFLNALEF